MESPEMHNDDGLGRWAPNEAGELERVWSLAELGEAGEAQFIKNMVRFREQKGMTQGGLASMLRYSGIGGMHQTTLSRIEKGERALKFHEALAIAKALGSTVEQLLQPTDSYAAIQEVYRTARELDSLQAAMAKMVGQVEDLMLTHHKNLRNLQEIDIENELTRVEVGRLSFNLQSIDRKINEGVDGFMLEARRYYESSQAEDDDGEH